MKLNLLLLFLFLLIFGLLTVAIHTALRSNTLGFDYMFYWHAGRSLFVEGLSPYSAEITQRIQVSAYGRPALPGEYPYPYPYPLPIVFVPLPLYFLSLDWSQAAWMAFCLLAVASIGPLAFHRAPNWFSLTLLLFYHAWFTLIIGNYALLFTLLLALLFAALLFEDQGPGWADVLLGIGLAWMTNKPQMVWLFAILALVAALRLRRLNFLYGFGGGLVVLHLASLLLLPGWIAQWLNVAKIYPQASMHVPALVAYLRLLLPVQAAWEVGAVLAVPLLSVTGWLFWRWWHGRLDGLLLLGWCGMITSLFDVSALTPDQLVLLVPLLLWVLRSPGRAAKLAWGAGIILTNGLFVVSRIGLLPEAVDRGPLLVYLIWLAWAWIRPDPYTRSKRAVNPVTL